VRIESLAGGARPRRSVAAALVALCAAGAPPLRAQGGPPPARLGLRAPTVALAAGTLGLGLEASALVTERVAGRLGVYYFRSDRVVARSGVDYDTRLTLRDVAALADFFPRRTSAFRLTAGLVATGNEVTAASVPSSAPTVTINDRVYPMSEVGVLHGAGKLPSAAPYLGLGVGRPGVAGRRARVRFSGDLGAVLARPKVSWDATGAPGNPQLAADVAADRRKKQREVNRDLPVYPVLAVAVGYEF
jgi:hypothetical protein